MSQLRLAFCAEVEAGLCLVGPYAFTYDGLEVWGWGGVGIGVAGRGGIATLLEIATGIESCTQGTGYADVGGEWLPSAFPLPACCS